MSKPLIFSILSLQLCTGLKHHLKIPLADALTGYTVHLTTLDGRSLTVPISSVIHPGYEEVVRGEGMPLPKEPSKKGNLRVKFDIKFPARLTADQKTGVKRLLGQ